MKLLNKKLFTIVLATVAIVCFSLFASTVKVNASSEVNVPYYTVTIEAQVRTDARTLTNRIPISSDATKVVFEYEPLESSGTGNYYAIVGRSGEDQGTNATVAGTFGIGYGVPNGSAWISKWAIKDAVYTLEFDLVNRTADMYVLKPGATDVEYYFQDQAFSQPNLSINYVGFAYGATDVNEATVNNAWQSKLKVRCYDDKGRDLQVAPMEGTVWIDGLSKPSAQSATLSSFDTNDYVLNSTAIGVGEMALTTSVVNVIDAENVAASGASGKVLSIKTPPAHASFAIQFGRILTKADIEKGGSLVLRVWSEHNNTYLYGCNIAPYDIDARDVDRVYTKITFEKAYFQEIMNIGNAGVEFVDLEISGDDLLKLCDDDGNVKGIAFWMGGTAAWGGANYTVYIDDIYYKVPVELKLHDATGRELVSKTVYSGASLNEQCSVIVPEVAGKEFVGWTKTLNGQDYYDVSEIGYADANLSLYASFNSPVADESAYVGVYANAESGKYFELLSDGSVLDITGAVEFSKYKVTQGIVLFDDTTVATEEDFVINVGGVQYAKAEQAHKVNFNVLGKSYKTITVPNGYKAIQFEYDTTDFVFGGWKIGEELFDFNSQITSDLILEAALTVNEIAKEDYAEYQNAYYSSKTGIVYIVKAPDETGARKFVKVENGQVSVVGDYVITKNDKLFVNDNLYDFEPMNTTASTGEKYVGPLEIIVDGVDYWIFNREFTVTVHYNDAENTVETYKVNSDDNFMRLQLVALCSLQQR